MKAMRIINSNIFPLPGNSHMLHLGTIAMGIQEYVVMLCVKGPKRGNCYIEETVLYSMDLKDDVTAYCKFIKNDALAEDLAAFADEKGLTSMKRIEELLATGRSSWILNG